MVRLPEAERNAKANLPVSVKVDTFGTAKLVTLGALSLLESLLIAAAVTGAHGRLAVPAAQSFLPLVAAGMIGTVVGFLLLGERDEQMMPALLVTPLSLRRLPAVSPGSLTLVSACSAP